MNGAIEIEFTYGEDAKTEYIILTIREFRNSGAVFEVADTDGAHLLSADDIRANWNAWVGDLIRNDQIVSAPPAGVEVY